MPIPRRKCEIDKRLLSLSSTDQTLVGHDHFTTQTEMGSSKTYEMPGTS